MVNHSPLKDTGAFFTIIPETREIKVPTSHKVIGVVGDHLAEQLTFELPRFIDGHDIEGCTRRYISWLNVNGEPGNDQLEELKVPPEGAKEGMIYLTWTIRNLLAVSKGVVQFSLHFECLDADGATVRYHWGTAVCKNCEILDSVNHAIGVYSAMWVAGDTLVISDYTPVTDGVLDLQTPGIVPDGTLEITENGVHDVGLYAQVSVAVPPKEVSTELANGKIVNNSSWVLYADFTTRDRENFGTGVKENKDVEIPSRTELRIDGLMRLTNVGIHRIITMDIYGQPTPMPSNRGIAFGVCAGCTGYDPGDGQPLGLVAHVPEIDFYIEIVDEEA